MQMSGFFGATRRNGRFVSKEIEKSGLGNDWQSKANFFGRKSRSAIKQPLDGAH